MTLLLFLIPVLLVAAVAPLVFRERPGVRRPLGLPRSHRRDHYRDLLDLAG